MNIYLIRHTAPSVKKGVCYGQADIDVVDTFLQEAAIIQQYLPAAITEVYSSPLLRCKKLAEHLFPTHTIQFRNDLKEINCGNWEMKMWDDISREEIDPWMENMMDARIPGGESYQEVFERVAGCFDEIICINSSPHQISDLNKEDPAGIMLVAHGGVIRSILSHITNTPLADSFKVFSLHYGCVIKIVAAPTGLHHEILSNIAHEKETHKPSRL